MTTAAVRLGGRAAVTPPGRLRAARAVLLIATVLLLGAAMVAGQAKPPVVRLHVAAVGPQDWLVSPYLLPKDSPADVVLSLAVIESNVPTPAELSVTECATGWKVSEGGVSCSTTPRALMSHETILDSVTLGRVGTLDPGTSQHYRVTLDSIVEPAPGTQVMLDANATPCAATTAAQLWHVDFTHPAPQANTVGGVEQCATQPAPFLPMGILTLIATLVAAVIIAGRRLLPS